MSRLAFLPFVAWAAGITGCGEGGSEEGPSEKTRASWVLTLKVDGADIKLPLESMDVYLVEDENYPEIFEIRGPGVALVGEFPKSIHVGYGGKWEKLFGQTVAILARGGHPREPRESHVTLPGGSTLKVVEGSFVANKKTGKYEHDITLWGRITLLVRDEKGMGFTVKGEFAVHATTWG